MVHLDLVKWAKNGTFGFGDFKFHRLFFQDFVPTLFDDMHLCKP
jgi:hypothetical protein